MAKTKKTAAAESTTSYKELRRAVAESGSSVYPDLTYAGNIIPMGGGYLGNISLINWARSAAIIQKQYEQIPVSHRLHNIIRDHSMANGLDIEANVTDSNLSGVKSCLQEIVKRTYRGKENRLDLKVGSFFLESSMFGELCLTADPNPFNGRLKVGYMPVRWIEKVIPDAFDPSEPDCVMLRGGVEWVADRRMKDGGKMNYIGQAVKRKVIRYNLSPFLTDDQGNLKTEQIAGVDKPIRNPNYGKLAGDVFFSKLPGLLANDRGRGDTFAVADWVNKLDQGIYDFLQRYDAQAAHVYDLLIKGGTPDDIAKKAKIRLPTGLKPYVHNELEELKLLAPSIRIDDLTNFIRTLVILIAGTVGVPEMLLADGSKTNVATAEEQTPALYAMFNMRRHWFGAFMETVMRYAIECANDAGVIYSTDSTGKKTLIRLDREQLDAIEIAVNFTPFERSNAQKLSGVLGEVISALVAAEQQGYISKETAATVTRSFISQTGTDIDNDSENQKMLEERGIKLGGNTKAAKDAVFKVNPATAGMTPSGNGTSHQDIPAATAAAEASAIVRELDKTIDEARKAAEVAAGQGRVTSGIMRNVGRKGDTHVSISTGKRTVQGFQSPTPEDAHAAAAKIIAARRAAGKPVSHYEVRTIVGKNKKGIILSDPTIHRVSKTGKILNSPKLNAVVAKGK